MTAFLIYPGRKARDYLLHSLEVRGVEDSLW